jgi:hypothetical protein
MGTDIGIRFKTARGRGGAVEDIIMRDIRMTDILGEAISFSMFYEGKEGSGTLSEDRQPVTEETPVFRNLHMENITCTGAEVAFLIKGLTEMPVEGLSIRGYKAVSRDGIICGNAAALTLADVDLQVQEGPLVKLHQCRNVKLLRLVGGSAAHEGALIEVTGDRTADIAVIGPQQNGLDTGNISIGAEAAGSVQITVE